MFQIVYSSEATVPFLPADLTALLAVARIKNRRNAVTGMLVFCRGQFLQALEGDTKNVVETFERIEKDPRHRHLRTLYRGMSYLSQRFGEWSMGFMDVANAHNMPVGFVRVNNQINLAQFDDLMAIEFLAACGKRPAAA